MIPHGEVLLRLFAGRERKARDGLFPHHGDAGDAGARVHEVLARMEWQGPHRQERQQGRPITGLVGDIGIRTLVPPLAQTVAKVLSSAGRDRSEILGPGSYSWSFTIFE